MSEIKIMKAETAIGLMLPGTQFMFRGKRYLRVCGPWEDGEIPALTWLLHPSQMDQMRLAGILTNKWNVGRGLHDRPSRQ